MRTDLASGANPTPAAKVDFCLFADLKAHAVVDKRQPFGDKAPSPPKLQPSKAHNEPRVFEVDHAVRGHELEQGERAAVEWWWGQAKCFLGCAQVLGSQFRFCRGGFHPVKVRRRGWRAADAAAVAPAGMIRR